MFTLSDSLPTARSVPTTHLWQLWPGRHWPLLADEELQFRRDLSVLAAGKHAKPDRGDYTAVLNAIRCGLSIQELFVHAPGLRPARLLSAYDLLEAARGRSQAAWDAVMDNPVPETFLRHQEEASRLLPVPIDRLRKNYANSQGRSLHEGVREAVAEIARVRQEVAGIESALRSGLLSPADAVAHGRQLYNPYDPTLWGHASFLPDRVGSLMPPRVADLLGERRR